MNASRQKEEHYVVYDKENNLYNIPNLCALNKSTLNLMKQKLIEVNREVDKSTIDFEDVSSFHVCKFGSFLERQVTKALQRRVRYF
jgi:hypothetical protein